MRVAEKLVPLAGAASAVSALACCLPLGGSALFGMGSVLAAAATYQEWLLPTAGVCLALGAVLIWRTRRVCRKTSWATVAIWVLSAAVVLAVVLAPQSVAGFLADYLS